MSSWRSWGSMRWGRGGLVDLMGVRAGDWVLSGWGMWKSGCGNRIASGFFFYGDGNPDCDAGISNLYTRWGFGIASAMANLALSGAEQSRDTPFCDALYGITERRRRTIIEEGDAAMLLL